MCKRLESSYYLIVNDLLNFTNEHNIPEGTNRIRELIALLFLINKKLN